MNTHMDTGGFGVRQMVTCHIQSLRCRMATVGAPLCARVEGRVDLCTFTHLLSERCDRYVVGYLCHVDCVYKLLHLLKSTLQDEQVD